MARLRSWRTADFFAAVVHMIAIAGRLGIKLTLDDIEAVSEKTPYLVNVRPSGQYLMEDFSYAGCSKTA